MVDLWTGWHGPVYIVEGDYYGHIQKDKRYDLDGGNQCVGYMAAVNRIESQKLFPSYEWAKEYIEQSSKERDNNK